MPAPRPALARRDVDQLILACAAVHTASPKNRAKKLARAKDLACALMVKLTSKLFQLVGDVLEESQFTLAAETKAPVRDLALADRSLRAFHEDPSDLVAALKEVLALRQAGDAIIAQVEAQTLALFKGLGEQKLDRRGLADHIARLKGHFCSGGGGETAGAGPSPRGKPPSPDGMSLREQRIWNTIFALLGAAALLGLGASPSTSTPREPTPIVAPAPPPSAPTPQIFPWPFNHRLAALLLLAALVDDLSARGELPARQLEKTTPPGAEAADLPEEAAVAAKARVKVEYAYAYRG